MDESGSRHTVVPPVQARGDVTSRKRQVRGQDRKRESRDAALMKGTEDWMAAGLDLESLDPTPESVKRLSETVPPSTEAERAAACWLGFAEIPESAELLARMESKVSDKQLKREVRRSLFRLEQRGIAPPRASAEPAASPALGREEDRGFLSHVDGRGEQVVWFVRPERSGDYYVLSGVVNYRRGLREADAGRVARPALRDLLERTRRRFSLRLLPADAAWCDLVLHEAYRQSDAKRDPGISRFPALRMEVSHRVPARIPCPVQTILEEELPPRIQELLGESARLLDEPELSGWLLDPEEVAPFEERLRELSDSPLVLNRLQQEERREKAHRAARAAIFAGEARADYGRRMEAQAYFFHLDGRADAARRALAVHRALAPGSPDLPEEIPFVVGLASRTFRVVEESWKAREKEEKRTSLIVKPGEA
jgi:hypothetical protein